MASRRGSESAGQRRIPRLYPIVDAESLAVRGFSLEEFAGALRTAGVRLLQYRDKMGAPQEVLRSAGIIRAAFAGTECRLILNDRADLALLAGWDGVHVGQGDLSVADARRVLSAGISERVSGSLSPFVKGCEGWGTRRVLGEALWVGVSTHNEAQVKAAEATDADYVAMGPVFATGTKRDAEPVVGLEGVRRARALTNKPLVAIGGITRENARQVIEAGADSVAVIGALFAAGETVEQVARDFLDRLG